MKIQQHWLRTRQPPGLRLAAVALAAVVTRGGGSSTTTCGRIGQQPGQHDRVT